MSGSCGGGGYPGPIPGPLLAALAKLGRALTSAGCRRLPAITAALIQSCFSPSAYAPQGRKALKLVLWQFFSSHPLFLPGEPSFQVIQPLPPEPPGRELQRFHRTSIKLLLPS